MNNSIEQYEEEKKLYFFIIDEINRANLSKVFGELMFGLEKDKRGEVFKTQYSNLPTYDIAKKCELGSKEDVFADGFYIPSNVVILGTMNDIDRSVDSMDFALRRRFEWIEFVVDEEMLTSAFTATIGGELIYGQTISKKAKELAKQVVKLNEKIKSAEYGLNEAYFISQGQFANIPSQDSVEKVLNYVWEYRIKTLLKEYLRGEDSIEQFILGCEKVFLSMGKDEGELDEKTNTQI